MRNRTDLALKPRTRVDEDVPLGKLIGYSRKSADARDLSVYQVADVVCRAIRAMNGIEGETIDDN